MNLPSNWQIICAINTSHNLRVIARLSKTRWRIEKSKLPYTRPCSAGSSSPEGSDEIADSPIADNQQGPLPKIQSAIGYRLSAISFEPSGENDYGYCIPVLATYNTEREVGAV